MGTLVWLADGLLDMAGGNVTVSHITVISRCVVHFVVQNNHQRPIGSLPHLCQRSPNEVPITHFRLTL